MTDAMVVAGESESEYSTVRERLLAANVLMRNDYAWMDAEFRKAVHRLTGIGCRLLYLHSLWREKASHNKVLIEANGYSTFQERLANACKLMGYEVVTSSAQDVHLVFLYIAPPSEARTDAQYATFESISKDKQPIFCCLLGDASFLEPPADDEVERLRGLSGFAISQQLQPVLEEKEYGIFAQYAVEFLPPPRPNGKQEDKNVKDAKLESLMNRFGCVDHNLMHHTEKWEFMAPHQSRLCQDEEFSHLSEEEARFWLEYAKGKACDQCHALNDKLSTCARCHDAFYCSRDCQKAAWKLHKRLCGKTHAEITAE